MAPYQITACQECNTREKPVRWRDVPFMRGILLVVVCDDCYQTLLRRADNENQKEQNRDA